MAGSTKATQGLTVRWSNESQSKEEIMREHSGAEGKNNNRNPTLRDAERAKGRSGEAVAGDRLKRQSPERKSTAKAS